MVYGRIAYNQKVSSFAVQKNSSSRTFQFGRKGTLNAKPYRNSENGIDKKSTICLFIYYEFNNVTHTSVTYRLLILGIKFLIGISG